ncbi:MAG: universal stress protein [Verrucomicrobiales bacterium]|nr:universal stress protein [Verrucomicrobiales bacterium]
MSAAIRRILTPIDVSAFAEAASRRSCEVALRHGAEITGLVVLDSPGIRSSVAPADVSHWPLVQDAVMRATADAAERIHRARDRFARVCGEQSVCHRESELEGIPADKILEASVLHDLVVMGLRTFFHFETQKGPGDSLAKVLGRTVTPVLAVPESDAGEPYRRAVVAWDGSFSSGRAFRDFLAFAAPYDLDLTVLTATTEPEQGELLLREAEAFLEAHGVSRYRTELVKTTSMEEIQREHLSQADLIVAGIHSRRFFVDLFVGSFTNRLIENGDTALYLSH